MFWRLRSQPARPRRRLCRRRRATSSSPGWPATTTQRARSVAGAAPHLAAPDTRLRPHRTHQTTVCTEYSHLVIFSVVLFFPAPASAPCSWQAGPRNGRRRMGVLRSSCSVVDFQPAVRTIAGYRQKRGCDEPVHQSLNFAYPLTTSSNKKTELPKRCTHHNVCVLSI